MAKPKSIKRKRSEQGHVVNQLQSVSMEPRPLQIVVSDDQLEEAIETLNLLREHPHLIKSKRCKVLRAAVYDFRQACTTGVNAADDTSLTARITATLNDGKYLEARILLAEMREREEKPKLGALCRWIRDLDVISGLSRKSQACDSNAIERSPREIELLRVLDAILRVTGPVDISLETITDHDPSDTIASRAVSVRHTWDLLTSSEKRGPVLTPDTKKNHMSGGVLTPDTKKNHMSGGVSNLKNPFRIIENTPGPLRKPPNHHPAILYASDERAFILLGDFSNTSIEHHLTVPNLSFIKDVLSELECSSIIHAAEEIGFLPDAPIRDDSADSSVLAHNVYWLIDNHFHDKLWSRISQYVPGQISGKKARGLNRRFRVYRYVPSAEYRCHIDGAWPPSGIDPVTKTYLYDSSPPNARQSSLFTFLIYLNDDFEGGETTFFLPSLIEGVLNAYPVRPVMGSVLMFPHGDANGALLHEGTGVVKGIKYVIRTDVEYDVDAY